MALEADRLPLGSEHPYGGDTEHDQRVRTRLAELAAERGMTVDDVLQQLNAAIGRGEAPFPAGVADEGEGESGPPGLPRSPQATTIVRQRPGDEVWGVTSLEYQGPPVAQRSPCAGTERCPWRRDAEPGTFPAEAFRLSAPTSYPDSDRRFGCHSSTAKAPRVCAGWLLRGASGNRQVQELLDSGRMERPSLPEGVELYDDYAEMAVANGVNADDPALASCRKAVTQGDSGQFEFASLSDLFAAGAQDRDAGGSQ